MIRALFAILFALPMAASANMLLAPSGGAPPSAPGSNVCKTAWVDQGQDNLGTTLTVWINVGC